MPAESPAYTPSAGRWTAGCRPVGQGAWAEALCVHPQALPLRSYHFQKVGKKPELTLVWEPQDPEQEPVQQVEPWPTSPVNP